MPSTAYQMQSLLLHYITIESHHITNCVALALGSSRDGSSHHHASIPHLRSIPDQVFTVISDSCSRVKSTCDVETVCAFINVVNGCLCDPYFKQLTKQSNVKSGADLKITAIGINNLESTSRYILEIQQQIQTHSKKAFARHQQYLEKVQARLQEFNETERKFRTLLQNSMESLCGFTIPKVMGLMSGMDTLNYNIEKSQLLHNKINDPFFDAFLTAFESLLEPYKTHLNAKNFETLLIPIIQRVVDHVEKVISAKKFSQWGAQQFERELMAIISFFSARTTRNLRDRFLRLQQLSQMLSLEQK